jgi:hypothetical protein
MTAEEAYVATRGAAHDAARRYGLLGDEADLQQAGVAEWAVALAALHPHRPCYCRVHCEPAEPSSVQHPAAYVYRAARAIVAARANVVDVAEAAEVPAAPVLDATAESLAEWEAARETAERVAVSVILHLAARSEITGYAEAASDRKATGILARHLAGRTEAARVSAVTGRLDRRGFRNRTARESRLAAILDYAADVRNGRLSWADVAARLGVTDRTVRGIRKAYAAAFATVGGPLPAVPEPNRLA